MEGRGGLSGNVTEEAFCLKSAPAMPNSLYVMPLEADLTHTIIIIITFIRTKMQIQYKREVKYIHTHIINVRYITIVQYFQSTHNTCSIFC